MVPFNHNGPSATVRLSRVVFLQISPRNISVVHA